MRSIHRVALPLTDQQLLDRPDDIELLRAVVRGRVTRADGSTAISAPHVLDGLIPVRPELRRLADYELIWLPISGPPVLAPRGQRLLRAANGEEALSPEG